MKIQIIPGPRDEKKIETINQIHATADAEQWEEFVFDCAGDEGWMPSIMPLAPLGSKRWRIKPITSMTSF